MKKFTDFPLDQGLLNVLNNLGYTEPTEIQARTLPLLLTEKKIDLHGQAQTGTGKTLAFGLPLVQRVEESKRATQALIIAPTRELVVQIHQSLSTIAPYKGINIVPIYGGVSMDRQFRDLKRGAHIVIGTPGRLNDHLRRKTLLLNDLNTIVLDEADIMLDMGFKQEIDEILAYTPNNKNIWLFSATVKPGIHDLIKTHMKNTVSVSASKMQVASSNTKQYYCQVPTRSRFEALCRFIDTTDSFYGFIFCPTKIITSEVAERLAARGYKANALHGDMNQARRNQVIKNFKDKEFTILVATDVAARGIDVSDITHVINYGLPDDQESYIHRIGRTGRAGKQGIAVTFIDPRQMYRVRWLEKKYQVQITAIDVPGLADIVQKRVKEASAYLSSMIDMSELTKEGNDYVEPLQNLLSTYSQKQLQGIVMNVLIDKFFKHIQEQKDISFAPAQRDENAEGYGSERRSRFSRGGRGRGQFFHRKKSFGGKKNWSH